LDDVVAGDLHYFDGTLISTSGTGQGPGDALHVRNVVLTTFHLVLPNDERSRASPGARRGGRERVSFTASGQGSSTQATIGVKSISLDL